MKVLNIYENKIVRVFVIEFGQIVNPVYPMSNLKKSLFELNQNGFVLGIISNAQFFTDSVFGWFLEDNLEGLGFHPYLIFYSYQFGYAKPSLFLFQEKEMDGVISR